MGTIIQTDPYAIDQAILQRPPRGDIENRDSFNYESSLRDDGSEPGTETYPIFQTSSISPTY